MVKGMIEIIHGLSVSQHGMKRLGYECIFPTDVSLGKKFFVYGHSCPQVFIFELRLDQKTLDGTRVIL